MSSMETMRGRGKCMRLLGGKRSIHYGWRTLSIQGVFGKR